MIQEKKCSSCKRIRHITNFNKEPRNKDGFTGTCKSCRNEKRRGKRQTEGKKYRAKKYGLSLEEYEQYFNNASCGICGALDSLCLDHNHNTGEIRGVLCVSCNLGLGYLQDNVKNLKGAIRWLEVKGSYGNI